jgi:diguanylate cyclase (GGDEF)-like protein/PAS domain S-box-containing protein
MLKKLRLGFFIGSVILIVDAAIPLILAHRVTTLRAAADNAETTRDDLYALLSAYKDAETGQRGFMLTGRQDFLNPYTQGRATAEQLLPQLRAKFQSEPQQAKRFAELLALDAQEASFQKQRIEQRNETNWLDISASEHGKMLMDNLRAIIADLDATERTRTEALLRHVTYLQRWSLASLIAITALDLILFGLIFLVMTRSIRAEQAARSALTDLNKNFANEIALRTEAMSRLEEQSSRLNEVVQMQAVLAETQFDIDAFMNEVVQRMLVVTPAVGAVIEMIEGDEMVYIAASGSIEQFLGLRLLRAGSLSGLCVAKTEVMIATDTNTDARVNREACVKINAAAIIIAPLVRANEPVGVLKIVGDKPHAFDDSAVQTLRLMAGFLGAALGNQLQFKKNESLLAERNITLAALKRELQRREEYEQKLLLQRQRTESILETSHEAFISIDAQGYIREWNALAATTFGWNKQEALGQLLESMIIPERLRAAHRSGIAHYLKSGEGPVLNKRIELSALCRDGREIPIELTISVLRDGDQIEFPCFLRDISERKQAESILLNQRSTLHAMTNAIPALIALIDADGHYDYCNEEYARICGVPTDEIVGLSLRQHMGEARYQEFKSHIDRAFAGEPVTYENTYEGEVGLRHQECRFIPQFDANGKPDGFYSIVWDITERKTQEIEWQSRASVDPLTSLLNRASFAESLNLALSRHLRVNTAIALLYLDIDRFKLVNDTYGHAAGDALLKAFANYLKQSVRQSDVIGRFGGDEFCIVLDDIKTSANAITVAEKILATVRTPVVFENQTLTISTSIGIAFAQKTHLSGEQLIATADTALYKAKQAGRNRHALSIVPIAELAQH